MDIGKLPFFQLMKQHFAYTGQRQTVLAENLANVDTPGFKARDLTPFDEKNFGRMLSNKLAMDTRSAGHITPAGRDSNFRSREDENPWEISRTGNTVVLEDQVMQISSNRGAHRLTSEVYSKQLGMLRTTLQMTSR